MRCTRPVAAAEQSAPEVQAYRSALVALRRAQSDEAEKARREGKIAAVVGGLATGAGVLGLRSALEAAGLPKQEANAALLVGAGTVLAATATLRGKDPLEISNFFFDEQK